MCVTFATQGLSLTSLKAACRKLGIFRWPYTRPGYASHGSNSSSGDDPNSSSGDSHESIAVYAPEPTEASSSAAVDVIENATGTEGLNEIFDGFLPASLNDEMVAEMASSVSNEILDSRWLTWFINCDETSPISIEDDE